MTLVDAVAGLMLVSLGIYVVTGGADFGGGVWDLLARGPQTERQRATIEHAIAPVWEANHVWLIFLIVLLFTGFPAGFAAIGVAFFAPLSLVMLGIVMRGAGFVFRQYGEGGPSARRRWGRVFAIASTITPMALGACVGVWMGGVDVDAGAMAQARLSPLSPLPLATGAFVLVLVAYLAAVYLVAESEGDLQRSFRTKALASSVLAGALAFVVRLLARREAPAFADRAFDRPGWGALELAVAALAAATLVALFTDRARLARALAVTQLLLVVAGWGWALYPFLLPPQLTLARAAAPPVTLRLLLIGVSIGTIVLAPSLYALFAVFKSGRLSQGSNPASGATSVRTEARIPPGTSAPGDDRGGGLR